MIEPDAPLLIFDELDSTNEEARRRAAQGLVTSTYLLARRQSAGRGRRGRAWVSAEGNLFLTYLGVTTQSPSEIALFGFAAGLALAEFCDAAIGPGLARLKWPNDLMLDGRKAAGLLLESGALGEGRNWFAIGIGFNLTSAPEGVGQSTAALGEFVAARPPSPETVARDLAVRLARWSGRLREQGFAPLRDAWTARAFGLQERIFAENGGRALVGLARGLSAHGELLVEQSNGEVVALAAGDILFQGLAPA
jgi:BirA family transcriptional regulator, biotin operon repressor / biotin---[acetyl-CoA-carboxylase] ligase